MAGAGLLERLAEGHVICAEGYLFELERRGYLQAGAFVPEAVLDHPEKVTELHREFVHAGSDVVEAFTYYAHREKMRIVGKEGLLEELNRNALALAKEVADESGTLLAGDICNTNVFDPGDSESLKAVRAMFDEQVAWAAEAGVDFVIAETYSYAEEARMALEAIKAAGLPAVVTMCIHQEPMTREGLSPGDACAMLEQAGADVVGLNCIRGVPTTMELLPSIREQVSGYVAALPVPYMTTAEMPTFQSLRHPRHDGMLFPTALEPFEATRYEVAEFGREADDLGIQYLGLCCGNSSYLTRALAEALGRTPPASRYSPDMSKHAYYGTDPLLKPVSVDFADQL
ncbi:MAG TPA: homocysteine S-methyltransferase family protein [Gaiellaceae bacterium]